MMNALPAHRMALITSDFVSVKQEESSFDGSSFDFLTPRQFDGADFLRFADRHTEDVGGQHRNSYDGPQSLRAALGSSLGSAVVKEALAGLAAEERILVGGWGLPAVSF